MYEQNAVVKISMEQEIIERTFKTGTGRSKQLSKRIALLLIYQCAIDAYMYIYTLDTIFCS